MHCVKLITMGSICLGACASPEVVVGDLQDVTTLRAVPNRDLDVLFVVDNSPSMADKQVSLAQNFPRMIDVLSTLDGGLPNLHIGVVTSDMGTSASDTPPGPSIGSGPGSCDGTGGGGTLVRGSGITDAFISDIDVDGQRQLNYTGALRDAFANLALVGDAGCGVEQHLRAMSAAFDGHNAGFLRDDANLAVVILADEDDCSLRDAAVLGSDTTTLGPLQSFRCTRFGLTCDQPIGDVGAKSNCHPAAQSPYIDDVAPFASALVAVKGDARRVMVAGVVGDPSPVAVELHAPPGGGSAIPALAHSCTFDGPDGTEVADPAVRLAAFLDAFPGRSRRTSICSNDLSGALTDIGTSAKQLMGDPCIDTSGLADISNAPGIQPACTVVDIRDASPDLQRALPPCGDASGDCYELVADAAACPSSADHLRVRIHRDVDAAADTWTHVRCQPSAR